MESVIVLGIVTVILAWRNVILSDRNNGQAKIIEDYSEEINRLRAIVKQCDEDRREDN